MEPLISVIVPVYKVEPYLRKCVDSILSQTYTNLEVILVDDGSPDGCPAICDEYAAKDSRVKVIHKENGGLSDARNAGMAQATGVYLSFVDSDDLLPENAVEALLEAALRENAQLVIGRHKRFEDEPEQILETAASIQSLTPVEAMEDMLKNGCASWARLYRKEIHQDVLFPVGEINEDEAIVLRLLERCERIAFTNAVIYHYRCRPESITTASFSEKKLDWPKHCKANLVYIREHYPELEKEAAARYRGSLLWALTEIVLSNDDFSESAQQLIQQLREQKKLFWKTTFRFPQDRIRMAVLIYLPFVVYKRMLRLKRRV